MKRPKQAYTAEFKERAVKRVKEDQSIRAVVKELGLGDQTLRHGIKASAEGQLNGVGGQSGHRRQPQRLSGLEAWRQAGSPAPV